MTVEEKAKHTVLLKAHWDFKGGKYFYPDWDAANDEDCTRRRPYTLEQAWAMHEEDEEEQNADEQSRDYTKYEY
jgi:hypothetical protein